MIDMRTSDYSMIKLDDVDSTNEYAKSIAKEGAIHGTVVIAKKQNAGKGRLGRSFTSHEGKGIFMSIILRPDVEPELASRLTLVAAIAARRAIKKVCSIDLGIKWPNDLVIEGKKMCGILTEMSTEQGKIKYVVLGIGVNVLNESFDKELSDVATSVYMITGRKYDIDSIAQEIVDEFFVCYEEFIKTGTLTYIKQEYEKNLVNIHKDVKIINGNSVLEGICRGIGDEGELLIETENGVKKVISGEVSVRGVYGYV